VKSLVVGAMLEMSREAVPLFLIVKDCTVLEVPTPWLANVKLVGLNWMPATPVPVPVRPTDCGVFEALSLIVMVPVRVPTAVGVKDTVIEHDPPAASAMPEQLLESAKSPLMVTVEMFSKAVPEFVSVTFWEVLVVPTACDANVRLAGLSVTAGAPAPVPLNEYVCGLPGALSVRIKLPLRAPTAFGVNVIAIVHGVLGAMLAGQLFV
jgi:hypothetical protein